MTPDAPTPPEAPDDEAKRLDISLPADLAQRVAELPQEARILLATELMPALAAKDQPEVERLAALGVVRYEARQRHEVADMRRMMRGTPSGRHSKGKARASKTKARGKGKAQRKARRATR